MKGGKLNEEREAFPPPSLLSPPPNKKPCALPHTHILYLYLLTESSALDLNVCNRPRGLHSVSMDSPVNISDTVHLTAAYPSTPSPTGNPVIMSKYYDHLTSTAVEGGNPTIACGLITELNICDFAHQIASGLQHLESMNVSLKYRILERLSFCVYFFIRLSTVIWLLVISS